ncbi:MAG TPA: insulinase family protein, partial [Solirubrobacterales bacterium]|nr:insulinase family protein [Solirubrobacterales bacterium]
MPERTIVSIVGDLDPDQALALAARAYGDWPARAGAVDPSPEEPRRREVRARTLRGDVTRGELALGWRTVPPLHPDSTALDLASAVLAGGRGSWLYRALREPGLVTWVAAHNYAPTEVGVFSVAAELEPDRLPEVIAKVAEGVNRLVLLGPSAEELARARTLLRARWARRLESMEGRASALAAAEALEDVALLDREYEALTRTTAEQVRDATARYLHPDAVAGVAYQPEGEGPDLSAEALERAFAVTELAPVPAPGATQAPQPTPRRAAGRRTAEVLHTELPGIDLLVRRKPGVPLANLGLYAPRVRFESPAQAGLGSLLVRSALRGAGGLDAGELAYAFERLGGTLAPSAASDWLGFATSVLTEHLGEAAALLDRVYASPHLEDDAVAAERGLLIAEAEQVTDDMFRYPFQLAFAAAFGPSGYGLPVGGLPHTLPACTTADVRSWHREALLGVRPVLIAVGDFEPEEASALLAGAVGDRAAPAVRLGAGDDAMVWTAGADGEPPMQVVNRSKAQAALAMAFPGPGRRDPNRTAASVWAAVASGLGGRLFEALRDRRSLAYTVVASSWQKARGGSLLTYIATSPEREEEAREQMLLELERFAREPVAPEELGQAVAYLAGQAEVARQSGAAVAGEILEAWIAGTGLAELENPAARYRAVTTEDVRRVAETYLVPPRRAE